jgi:hypothetical protein
MDADAGCCQCGCLGCLVGDAHCGRVLQGCAVEGLTNHADYPPGSLKTNPFTCSIALRTTAPAASGAAWLISTTDGATRHASEQEMVTWDDILIGYTHYEPDRMDYPW